jgi:hypothetical protein
MFETSLRKGMFVFVVAAMLVVALCSQQGMANNVGIEIQFNSEWTSLDLSGGPFPIPLASDPQNLLGDSIDGYGFVDSEVSLTLSSQRAVSPGPPTPGEIHAFKDIGLAPPANAPPSNTPAALPVIDPDALDGELFNVNSFFDVFFDITVTDVDRRAGRDFAGQPDGASLALQDNGPGHMQSNYQAIFDKDAPNFGLFPPAEIGPFIGLFDFEISLGGDINGNGEADKIKIVLGSLSAGDQNRQFITLPNGVVINQFDAASFIQGLVVDVSTDPPFMIGAKLPSGLPDPNQFGGPTTASSELLNPILPEPTTLSLLALGALAIIRKRRTA